MPHTYAFRAEISGGFSGSAYRYESLLTGSLAAVERFIAAMTEEEQAASMMVTEGFAGVIDVLRDGECVHRTSFLPALRFAAGGHSFVHDGRSWVMDGQVLDDDTRDARLDEIIDAFLGGFTREITLAALELPEVEGEPLREGASITVTNAAGKAYDHVCGQTVGDFGEAHEYA